MTDDKLDRILRNDARQALPEGDFTARVMAALPARAARPMRITAISAIAAPSSPGTRPGAV